ncbi:MULTISPECIES: hypothetical protein [unclassified Streptomyces]|uniref:hypothetical protein n=1 Tax=unclassified Streptomyces TaxID=2593676 RepID=UPI000C28029A|nr:hypothetical protein [Streptomyces sp. CB02959]PJN42308.1 hypothetical protein CG747_00815 [Streptomyces sp. CB02959]
MQTVASQANAPEHTGNPHPVGSLHPELVDMANELAPRLFAVAQQYPVGGGEMDGHIAAWGLAYEDGRAQVISAGGRAYYSLSSPESAVRWFGGPADTQAWLIWPGAGGSSGKRSA